MHRTEFVTLTDKMKLRRGVAEQCPYLEAITTSLLHTDCQYALGIPACIAS